MPRFSLTADLGNPVIRFGRGSSPLPVAAGTSRPDDRPPYDGSPARVASPCLLSSHSSATPKRCPRAPAPIAPRERVPAQRRCNLGRVSAQQALLTLAIGVGNTARLVIAAPVPRDICRLHAVSRRRGTGIPYVGARPVRQRPVFEIQGRLGVNVIDVANVPQARSTQGTVGSGLVIRARKHTHAWLPPVGSPRRP